VVEVVEQLELEELELEVAELEVVEVEVDRLDQIELIFMAHFLLKQQTN